MILFLKNSVRLLWGFLGEEGEEGVDLYIRSPIKSGFSILPDRLRVKILTNSKHLKNPAFLIA